MNAGVTEARLSHGLRWVGRWLLPLLFVAVLLPSHAWSQGDSDPEGVQLLDFLIGSWKGEVTSADGTGYGEREFRLVLDKKFIHIHNMIWFDSSAFDSSNGLREDWGMMSIDDARETMVLRQFSDDGAVTRYEADSVYGQEEITILFVAQLIENDPNATWARLTITIHSPDEFSELIERGVADSVITERLVSHWTRK